MKKATIVLAILVFLAGLALAKFTVSPSNDSFEMLQNTTVVRSYMLENKDTTGIVEISTNVFWADTTEELNVTPGKAYIANITFKPEMMTPGNYTIIITFSGLDYTETIMSVVKVIHTNWIYGYLLPNETYKDISYANMTISENNYSLVLVKGADAFLIKNEREIVKDKAEIRQFYDQYYRETFYPKESELESLNLLVQEFNNSRNARVRYAMEYGAEETCKRETGITFLKMSTGRDVLTVDDAIMACQIRNADPSTIAACGDHNVIYATLYFGIDVYNMDNNFSAYSHVMSGLTMENAADSFNKAMDYMESIRRSANSSKNSMLRLERCNGCIGVCPIMQYNFTALDLAISKLNELRSRALKIMNIETKASELLSKTNSRIYDVIRNEHKSRYEMRYENIRSSVKDLASRVNRGTSNVYSPELERKFAEVANSSASLEWLIENGDYSNITKLDILFEANVDRFESAKAETEAALGQITRIYDEVCWARQNASDYLIISEMNVQSGDPLIKKIEALQVRMKELDANFTTPLNLEMAQLLKDGYDDISSEVKSIAESKPSSSIVGRIVSKILRTERWVVLSVVGLFKPLTLSEKTVISEYMVPVTAIFIDFCLALALLIALVVYIIRNRKMLARVRQEITVFSLFAAATIIVAIIGTGTLYYLTIAYGGERTLNLFSFEIQKAGGVAIVVDEATASASQNREATVKVMRACGENVANALSEYNPSVYFINGGNCNVRGMTMNYSDCDAQFLNLPVIYIRYGHMNSISFRTLYAVNATLEGGDRWIASCHLARALR